MIFFCEDCGEKNDLGKENIKNGKAVFRCVSCQYLNSYMVSAALKETDILLKKITSCPEVIGTFLYHKKNRVINNHMPKMLHETDLEILGRCLLNSYLTAQSLYSDINEEMVTISDKHITIQKIEPDLFIFIVSKNLPLSETVQNLLISLIKKKNSNEFF
ncbi:MAG: hypothetical protein B6230_01475 [Desulfobacteraceae bacterium 4572_89]|nr:MAG: hypothetical protein B6230_01475 [Desulfobacteraceae bacterium 4572_89]